MTTTSNSISDQQFSAPPESQNTSPGIYLDHPKIRVGMVGLGMIFRETYEPLLNELEKDHLYIPQKESSVQVTLSSALTLGHSKAKLILEERTKQGLSPFQHFTLSENQLGLFLDSGIDVVCVASPDDRHYEIAKQAILKKKHVLIEKPSVLSLYQLNELVRLGKENQILVKVVYHKLFDPDHQKLRSLYQKGILRHVNEGYCTLLEPISISTGQFSEWIKGRNPATYVAIHYIKLIDFSFAQNWRLHRIRAIGQRGIIDSPVGNTFDSVQLGITYIYNDDQREANFNIHTGWVLPNQFMGHVEQEVQFRFDNGVWNAHQRKRGVELFVEQLGKNSKIDFKRDINLSIPHNIPSQSEKSTIQEIEIPKITPNHHYNSTSIAPWNEPITKGYGLDAIRRFFQEVSYVEFGGEASKRFDRWQQTKALVHNDLEADRNSVAVLMSLEHILNEQTRGRPEAWVEVKTDQNAECTELVLHSWGLKDKIIYAFPTEANQ